MAEKKDFESAPKLTSVWESATPSFNGLVRGDPGALRQLRAMWDRSEAFKAHLKRHFAKYESEWVSREAIKLSKTLGVTPPSPVTAARAGPAPAPAPQGTPAQPAPSTSSADELTANSIMRQARANVRARMHRRLIQVNNIRTRHFNAVVNNTRDPFLSRRFQRAVEDQQPAPRYIRRTTR